MSIHSCSWTFLIYYFCRNPQILKEHGIPEGFSNSQVYESHTIGIFLSSLGIYSTPSHKKSILLQAKQNNKNVSVND